MNKLNSTAVVCAVSRVWVKLLNVFKESMGMNSQLAYLKDTVGLSLKVQLVSVLNSIFTLLLKVFENIVVSLPVIPLYSSLKVSNVNNKVGGGGFPFPPVGISLSPQAIKPNAANIASITAIIITNLLRKVNGFKIDLFIKSMFYLHKNTKFTGIFKMHKYGNNSTALSTI